MAETLALLVVYTTGLLTGFTLGWVMYAAWRTRRRSSMFNFIHRLTYCPIRCKNGEVHQLLPPESLISGRSLRELGPWNHLALIFKRRWNLSMEAWVERQNLSVPTPGPKDVSIG